MISFESTYLEEIFVTTQRFLDLPSRDKAVPCLYLANCKEEKKYAE